MKQGVSFFSFAQNVDVKEAAQQIKAAGYSGMEPVVSENGSLNPSMTDQEVLKIREIAQDLGLEIPSPCGTIIWFQIRGRFGRRRGGSYKGSWKLLHCSGQTLFWWCRDMSAVTLQLSRKKYVMTLLTNARRKRSQDLHRLPNSLRSISVSRMYGIVSCFHRLKQSGLWKRYPPRMLAYILT